MHTTSYWLTLPRTLMASLPYSLDDRRDGVAGLAFAMVQVAQLLLMCDRRDIGLSIGSRRRRAGRRCRQRAGSASEPRIFLYDNYPGGIGFSEPLFGMHDALVTDTRKLIAGCQCDHGCPTCVGPVGETGPEAKPVALSSSIAPRTSARYERAPRIAAARDPARAASRQRASNVRRTSRRRRLDPHECVEGRARLRAVADTLDGDVIESPTAPCVVVDRFYPADHRHGTVRIGDVRGLALSTRAGAVARRRHAVGRSTARRSPLLFVDLETTGLAGGAGTYAFLVGCALLRAARLPHPPVLPRRASSTSARCSTKSMGWSRRSAGLVSYNGKSFDVPVLETRYHFNRLAPPFEGYAARGHAARGAALLAQRTSGAWRLARHRQLPAERRSSACCSACGASATCRDSRFRAATSITCGSGNAERLEPVFEHNRLDLLSLALMTARALHVLEDAPARCTSARESLAAGRMLEGVGRLDDAERCYARCDRSFASRSAVRRPGCARRCHAAPRAAIPPRRAIHRGRGAVARDSWSNARRPRSCVARRSRRSRSITSTARETCRRRTASRGCRWPNASAPAGWRQAVIGWRVWTGNWRNVPGPYAVRAARGRRRIATER